MTWTIKDSNTSLFIKQWPNMPYRPCIGDVLRVGEDKRPYEVQEVEIFGDDPSNFMVWVVEIKQQ